MLFRSDDILTLQEYLGYCLIPSTKGQKMLIITGKGGEGKSRIGLVMRSLLGRNKVHDSAHRWVMMLVRRSMGLFAVSQKCT